MDPKLNVTLSDGHGHAVLRTRWEQAPTGWRYLAATCCTQITFADHGEVTRYGELWYITHVSAESQRFIKNIDTQQQALRTYCDGRQDPHNPARSPPAGVHKGRKPNA